MALFFINFLEIFSDFTIDKFEYEFGNPEKLSAKREAIKEATKVPFVQEVLDPKAIKLRNEKL